jgi:endonuclease/exonuclease/phosphatase family metal-dependent hydrolase
MTRVTWALALGLTACVGPLADSSDPSGGAGGKADEAGDAAEWVAPAPREGNLRIVTFNIRNFPVEPPQEGQSAPPLSYSLASDQEEILEMLAGLRFGLLAVQEIRDTAAFDALLAQLSSATGRALHAVWSENANGNEQHIGLVVDLDHHALDDVREHLEVDVSGTLRPGLSAQVTSLDGGADFRAMVVHLASGDSNKRRILRGDQVRAIAGVVEDLVAETGEADVVVLGDMNTAGGEEELPALDATMDASGLRRAVGPMACTSYWVKKSTNPLIRPSLLDQVYLGSFDELDEEVPVLAGGHCAVHACERYESRDEATGGTFWDVSDHCPVYFEVRDEDRDEPPSAP